jgi:hypothetical protein
MMHIQLEPQLRSGLNMMKFVMNHPAQFDKPFSAFCMGFALFWVTA